VFSILENTVVGVFGESVHVVETSLNETSLTGVARFVNLYSAHVGMSMFVDAGSGLSFGTLDDGRSAEERSSLN